MPPVFNPEGKKKKKTHVDREVVRFRVPSSFANAISMGKEPSSGTGYPKSNSLRSNLDIIGILFLQMPSKQV